MRFLILDSRHEVRRALSKILTKRGHEVVVLDRWSSMCRPWEVLGFLENGQLHMVRWDETSRAQQDANVIDAAFVGRYFGYCTYRNGDDTAVDLHGPWSFVQNLSNEGVFVTVMGIPEEDQSRLMKQGKGFNHHIPEPQVLHMVKTGRFPRGFDPLKKIDAFEKTKQGYKDLGCKIVGQACRDLADRRHNPDRPRSIDEDAASRIAAHRNSGKDISDSVGLGVEDAVLAMLDDPALEAFILSCRRDQARRG